MQKFRDDELLQEKEEKGHSSLDQLVQMFRDSWDSLCDVEITGLKVKMRNRERSKNYYLQGEELREILGPEIEALEEAFSSRVWISVAGGGGLWGLVGDLGWGVGWRGVWGGVRDLGGRGLVLFAGGGLVGTWVGELGGGGFGEGLETWVEGGLLREKCSYFVHVCSYLFRFVQVCSYLVIFCSDFVQICSYCSYLFIFGCGHVPSNYVQILPIFVDICSCLFVSEPPPSSTATTEVMGSGD